jgi:anti-anti-sigma factor
MADVDASGSGEPQLRATIDQPPQPGGAVIVRLVGDLDIAGSGEALAAVDRALEVVPSMLTFDLTELRFMDSSGIAVLLAAAGKVPTVNIRNPSAAVLRVLSLTGLAATFPVAP